jgi:gluconate 2-dehydrogenase gamma chain
VEVLCDLILPADERSVSATKAGVPEFIDDWLDFRQTRRWQRHAGVADTGRAIVARPGVEPQVRQGFRRGRAGRAEELLDRIAWPEKAAPEDHRWVAFFNRFRDLTVSGFFSSEAGVADLPYLGNKAVAEWKGCDPAVWAIIEKRLGG